MLSSCSSLTTFQTGRTNGKNAIKLDINGSAYAYKENLTQVVTPFLEARGSYGIFEKVDVNLSISSALSSLASIKYQFIGDQFSPFAISVEPGFEYQFSSLDATIRVQRYHFPVHLSVHSNNDIAYYISPKYVLQQADNIDHFAGFSTGIALKRSNEYFIGAGYFIPFNADSGIAGNLIQIGGGVRLNLNTF